MKSAIRCARDLGEDLVLAPERHVRALPRVADGEPLASFVRERIERVDPNGAARELVLDTTHARGGVVDFAAAKRVLATAKSSKKRAHPGDLLVSRLRPYLRQIALVPKNSGHTLIVSTEFYVLAPPENGADLAWLLPWLLSSEVQAELAAAQEGGHHPRVPRTSLLALQVPRALIAQRARTSRRVRAALEAVYDAEAKLRAALITSAVASAGRPRRPGMRD